MSLLDRYVLRAKRLENMTQTPKTMGILSGQTHAGTFTNRRVRNSRIELPGRRRRAMDSPQRHRWNGRSPWSLPRQDSACADQSRCHTRKTGLSWRVQAYTPGSPGFDRGNRRCRRRRKLARRMHAGFCTVLGRARMSSPYSLRLRTDETAVFFGKADAARCREVRTTSWRYFGIFGTQQQKRG